MRAPDIVPWAPRAPGTDTQPLTTEEITRIITAERARREPPSFTGEKAQRKKRRRAPRPRQRDLFDDFLAFLERTL
jgi:hypothetical protein